MNHQRRYGSKHGRPRGKRLHVRQCRQAFHAPNRRLAQLAGPFGCRWVGDAPMWRTPRVKKL